MYRFLWLVVGIVFAHAKSVHVEHEKPYSEVRASSLVLYLWLIPWAKSQKKNIMPSSTVVGSGSLEIQVQSMPLCQSRYVSPLS